MRTYETVISGDIDPMDFVIIATDSNLELGFYVGRGPTGTFQYYTLWCLSTVFERHQKNGALIKPNKAYINSPHRWRIAKCSPESLTQEKQEEYYKSIEALKLLKLIL
jgi:hypothetical protein